ncbi:hypothetical protein Q5752_006467 [Cryptotrichosporon argae]
MAPTPPPGLAAEHVPLFNAAVRLLATHFAPGRHEVAAALGLSDGSTVLGLHVEGSCGRSSICAEGIALGAALAGRSGLADGIATIVACVAVLYITGTGQVRVIAPCGVCRELLWDYAADAAIYTWIPAGNAAGASTDATRSEGERGFELAATETAAGEARQWIVRDLLPDKTRRKGW